MVTQIKEFKAVFLTDTTGTVISPMPSVGGTVTALISTTSTYPVTFSPSSTIQISGALSTTSTVPVSFAATSTIGAAVSWAAGSTVNVSWAATSTLGAAVTGAVTLSGTGSTVQAITAVGYTSTALWSASNVSANDVSGLSADISSYRSIGAFVTHNTASNVTVEVAHDTATAAWYPDSLVTLDAGGSMTWEVMGVGRFYRFKSSAAGTVTAIISAKG